MVPHVATHKTHQRLQEFSFDTPKRLLQQYLPIIDTKASLTIHGDNEFDWIIGFRAEWDDCATGLQVTPP